MYVDASSSGKGLGRLLINEVISSVKKMPDIDQINLTVVEHNYNAIRLYKSVGFEIIARGEGYN